MIPKSLTQRFRSIDPRLILFLSMMFTGMGHRFFPEYLNMWIGFIGFGPIPTNWIQLAGRVLILIGGCGAFVQYAKNPELRKWNKNIFNQGRIS